MAVGQKAAAGILALRADDGRAGPNPTPVAFIGENAVGKWRTVTTTADGYYDQMMAVWMGTAQALRHPERQSIPGQPATGFDQ